jgi:hypothetical protein
MVMVSDPLLTTTARNWEFATEAQEQNKSSTDMNRNMFYFKINPLLVYISCFLFVWKLN